jgi:acetyl-CoA carboxylase biotin carboxylase subunit
MRRALREFVCEGVTTTIPFHLELLDHPVFRSGDYHLDFIEKYMTAEGNLIVPEPATMRRAV